MLARVKGLESLTIAGHMLDLRRLVNVQRSIEVDGWVPVSCWMSHVSRNLVPLLRQAVSIDTGAQDIGPWIGWVWKDDNLSLRALAQSPQHVSSGDESYYSWSRCVDRLNAQAETGHPVYELFVCNRNPGRTFNPSAFE